MAAHLYSAELISDSTLRNVTTTIGISSDEKGHKLLQDCKDNIVFHDNPVGRIMEYLELLNEREPAATKVVDRINKQIGICTCTCGYNSSACLLL